MLTTFIFNQATRLHHSFWDSAMFTKPSCSLFTTEMADDYIRTTTVFVPPPTPAMEMRRMSFCSVFDLVGYLHVKCLHVVDELGSFTLCSLFGLFFFRGKLINMIQNEETTNAPALTLSPSSAFVLHYCTKLFNWVSLIVHRHRKEHSLLWGAPFDHNAVSNSIPIKSACC